MIVERVRAILRENADIFDAGVHEAAHRKVDDAIQPAERHCGFRAELREHGQLVHAPARENHGESSLHVISQV